MAGLVIGERAQDTNRAGLGCRGNVVPCRLVGTNPANFLEALDKSEGFVKDITTLGGAKAPLFFSRELRTKTLESHAKSLAAERRSTNHRFDHIVGHDSSMRTPRLDGMRERPFSFSA